MKKTANYLLYFSWVVFAVFLAYRVLVIIYPQPDAGGVEGNVIYFIQRILDGQPVYTDPELPPYSIAQYTPLYYYLVAGIGYAFKIGPDDVLTIYLTSRIIGLFLNLLFIVIVFRVARNIYQVSILRSLIVAIMAFIFLEITSFSRPDSLYHVLFLVTIYNYLKIVKHEQYSAKRISCIAIFAAFAFFAKQSAILLPLIISLWFIWQNQFVYFLKFSFVYLIALLSGIGILSMFGDTLFFYKNVVIGISNGISLGWFRRVIIEDFYLRFGWIFLFIAGTLLWSVRKDNKPLPVVSLFIIVVLFILNNLLAIKNGSNPGYFTEWWTLLLIIAAAYLPMLIQPLVFIKRLAYVAVVVLLLARLKVSYEPLIHMAKEYPFIKQRLFFNEERDISKKIIEGQNAGKHFFVFTNFNTAESYLSNLLFRNAVAPQMDIIGLASYPQKKYDYRDFVLRLKTGDFPLMIMRNKGPQKQFFEIKLDEYSLLDTTRIYNIYEYKKNTDR